MPNTAPRFPEIVLRSGTAHRCLAGHPWVLPEEFDMPRGVEAGEIVDVLGPDKRFVGRGYYNPGAPIAVRIFSRSSRVRLDESFFARRLGEADERRRRFLPENEPRRLVFTESDRLPGVVADRYGDYISIEFLTLGMDLRRDAFVSALVERYRPTGIHERSTGPTRVREGLKPRTGAVAGAAVPSELETSIDGIPCVAPLHSGQRTGLYLDQRLNWRRFGEFSANADVLDAFSYTGHFTLYALAAGASRAIAIEQAEANVRLIARNLALSGFEAELLQEDAFEAMRRLEAEGRRFGLVAVDPPSRLRAAAGTVGDAKRDLQDLNLRAIRLLAPGGILFTSCGSIQISREDFRDVIGGAARAARREVRLLAIRGPAPDHPVSLEIPETDYLKCFVVRAE